MRDRDRRWSATCLLAAVTLAAWVAGCRSCCHDESSTSVVGGAVGAGALLAGSAVIDVTPTGGAALAGFGGSPRRELTAATIPLNLLALGGTCFDPDPSTAATFFKPATGEHDPITARALVLANGTRKIALVKLDTIGMSRKLRDDLVAVAAPLGIAKEDLVVLATHTHSGPGGVSDKPLWQVLAADCYSDAIYQGILSGASTVLTQANSSLQPAQLGIGTTTVADASRNRRGRPEVVDRELGVVKITTTGGAPIAAMFNFAVHGTSLGQSNMEFSADCMGAMEGVIEAGLPGALAIFTNGAEGDVAPQHVGPVGLQKEGDIVGNAVLALWPTIATKGSIELRSAFQDVGMPAPSFNAATGCPPVPGTTTTLCSLLNLPFTIPLSPQWLSTSLPFQAIRIDDSVFVAIPGEPITEIGWELKQKAATMGFAHGFVLGLANDHGGYFTTAAEYQRAEYEGQATAYGPTTGAMVVQSASTVMAMVQ